MGEIVEAVHIFQKMALFQVAHAGGGAGGVQSVGDGIGAFVQLIAVLTFVDPYTPEDDAGMVAVLRHHFLYIFAGLFFPGIIA